MKKYKVSFKVNGSGYSNTVVSFEVEAGNKKMAAARGLAEFWKHEEYNGCYKNLESVEEVGSK